MSKHDYIRSVVDGSWDLTAGELAHKIEAALPGKKFTVNCGDTSVAVEFVDDLVAAEVALVDAEVSDLQSSFDALPGYKQAKISDIDSKTDELIAKGFVFSSKAFSLSLPAQSKMTAAHQIKDHPMFVYPVEWNTIDDTDTLIIPDAAAMDAFYLTAIGTIRYHLDTGTALKDQVRGANAIFEVDLVVDGR